MIIGSGMWSPAEEQETCHLRPLRKSCLLREWRRHATAYHHRLGVKRDLPHGRETADGAEEPASPVLAPTVGQSLTDSLGLEILSQGT